ncbi:MAG: PEP/pyruvate-binding domain-containing protein [Betaproteobacteria bacterium]
MPSYSTGLPALDHVLQEIRPGDNIVWQIDSITDYTPFVSAFIEHTLANGEKLIYFRFAHNRPPLTDDPGVSIETLIPEDGFEQFITQIHGRITQEGEGRNYIFDSMSDLDFGCYSDRMVGNFFKLTCTFLHEMGTVAYFPILRHHHSYHAAQPITETTQLLLDVYRFRERLYIQPQRVASRFSPTLFLLHEWQGEHFTPVKESGRITEVLNAPTWPGLPSASYRMIGNWDKQFMHGEEMLAAYLRGDISEGKTKEIFEQLVQLSISREERVRALIREYFTLADLIYIWKRMIGSGQIGGKSVGMLLARAILRKKDPDLAERLEAHDSFYIGSDVFYTYLVENNCWWERKQQTDPKTFLEGIDRTRDKILAGDFPEYLVKRFKDMLKYFGQAPIIVRSSSLLEDNFGNSFAGKYESVFCASQGTLTERLEEFLHAVRVIYASAMSADALTYRLKRGVLDQDEQMALLVQRVSGAPHGHYFFPQMAGVAFSYNSYAWNKRIDPEAGVMRIVFGLGTRAVDRADDDYTRVVALNAPDLRPEANFDQVRRYTQRRLDLLDLATNRFDNAHFLDIAPLCEDLPIDLYAVKDRTLEQYYEERGRPNHNSWILTFDNLLSKTTFNQDIIRMLKALRETYETHVDVEFTANFQPDGSHKINIVQCRPLQVKIGEGVTTALPTLNDEQIILEARGGVVGHSRTKILDWLVFVVPSVYGLLPENTRYEAARLIGLICHHDRLINQKQIMLIGPGRWGTSTASLGIPVSFTEINTASVFCEVDSMHEGLVPDLSLGTHFFNEMVEMDILYMAYFGGRDGNQLDLDFLLTEPNLLSELIPDSSGWESAIRVIDASALKSGEKLFLHADSPGQRALLYRSS